MPEPKKPSHTWLQCDEAIADISNPNEEDPINIQYIIDWHLSNRKLYESAKKETRTYGCTVESGEHRLCLMYDLISGITELYQKKPFYKGIVDRFWLMEHKQDELEKWLGQHCALAVETNALLGMDYWDDYCGFNKDSYPIKPIGVSETYLCLKGRDFINAIRFIVTYQTANRRIMYLQTDCKSIYSQVALVRKADVPTMDEIATHIQGLGYDFEFLQKFENSETSVSYSFLLGGESAFVEVNSSHPNELLNEHEWIKEDLTNQDLTLSMNHIGLPRDYDCVNLLSIALIDKSQAFIYFLGNSTIHTRETLLAERIDN